MSRRSALANARLRSFDQEMKISDISTHLSSLARGAGRAHHLR
jgi:hypothetical protein